MTEVESAEEELLQRQSADPDGVIAPDRVELAAQELSKLLPMLLMTCAAPNCVAHGLLRLLRGNASLASAPASNPSPALGFSWVVSHFSVPLRAVSTPVHARCLDFVKTVRS